MTDNDKCDKKVNEKFPPCPFRCRSEKCKSYKKPALHGKPIIWVIGGPGCGKGTQCAKISDKYGFTHLSVGELLRAEVKSGSERSQNLTDIMEKGELVSNELVLDLLLEAIEASATTSEGFLIDGYPREKSQGIAFVEYIAQPNLIIYFEATPETLTERFLSRAESSDCADDNKETIQLKVDKFYEQNQEILEQCTKNLTTINADRDIDEIFDDVQKLLDPMFAKD